MIEKVSNHLHEKKKHEISETFFQKPNLKFSNRHLLKTF